MKTPLIRLSALWVTLQESYSDLAMGAPGEYVGLNHWKSECDREVRRTSPQPAHGSWQIKFMPAVPKS